MEIRNDLLIKGFVNGNNKSKFFLKFLQSDRNHNNINIKESLYSLETYTKKRENNKTSISLEEFF
ncbi:hypothetical protein [uncultured Gammaproteobacteria bacterium]|nr:hypothetical protein [uncultured Gammaproteobacteria bacterium]CAC9605176.1 hypothetical protein [uncultured Gammaproteobacteria bacterium]CAC9951823.1 hypothetical protein [uncultured Gammaproteobacteria bacterium]